MYVVSNTEKINDAIFKQTHSLVAIKQNFNRHFCNPITDFYRFVHIFFHNECNNYYPNGNAINFRNNIFILDNNYSKITSSMIKDRTINW